MVKFMAGFMSENTFGTLLKMMVDVTRDFINGIISSIKFYSTESLEIFLHTKDFERNIDHYSAANDRSD